jgi:hypothetical protein
MVQNPRNAFTYTTKRATGPVVRIAPKTVIINDPYTIRRVLATKTDTDRYRLIESLSTAMVVQQYQASLPELNAFVHWLGSLPILRDIVFHSVNSPGGLGELMQVRIMSCRVQAHNAHLTPGHSAKDPGEDSCHKR